MRKIQYDFNSFSNRLLQADYIDYTDVLGKFLKFVDDTPIVYDYIAGCGNCNFNLEEEVKEVQTSYGRCIFSTGDTEEEEVRNVYAILHYLSETKNTVYHAVAMGYSSGKYQDKIKGFNERFVMVLIRHVERYLTKVGIDMGLDDKVIYNVTVHNGQAIIASDNATVTATNNVGVDADELKKLIANVQAASTALAPEDQNTVSECLEVIEAETVAEKPKKSFLRTAITTLRTVKGVTEFAAAAATLAEFVSVIL